MSNEYFSLILLLPLILYPDKSSISYEMLIRQILKSFYFIKMTKFRLNNRGQSKKLRINKKLKSFISSSLHLILIEN